MASILVLSMLVNFVCPIDSVLLARSAWVCVLPNGEMRKVWVFDRGLNDKFECMGTVGIEPLKSGCRKLNPPPTAHFR